jgi:hypothetical protein
MSRSIHPVFRAILSVFLFCFAAACSQGEAAQRPDPLRVETAPGSPVVASIRVDISASALRAQAPRLVLRPPEGPAWTLVRTSQERIGRAGYVWHGRIADDPTSSVTIVENRGAIAGTIFSRGGTFQLRAGPGGATYIDRIDPSRFRREAEPTRRSGLRNNSADPSLDTCTTDSGADIDIMVLYTDDARAAAGGTAQMEAEVYLAIAVSNESYANSNVTQRLRLVHTAEVNYAESGNTQTDRDRLKGTTDGLLDNIHAWRNTFAADVVMMIAQNYTNACGQSYIMDPVGNAFEDSAFGVTSRSCSAANLSFPHELGHQMSARHDWDSDPTDNSPYHFNHGYRINGDRRSVMAYPCAQNCPRQPNFSNPSVSFISTTTPSGTATEPHPTDNAQTLNLTAHTVANFRCSSAGRTDVWMKDTWSDTGAEPDPLTAGQPMYQSPTIWVLNAQDPQFLHQHQHQNPEFGSPNWAYVKLHNGGAAQTGTLRLYYGAASTGLIWPGSFTQIGAVTVTIPASSTRIVEIPWSNLPGVGHYCLVARWESTADPMHAEGSDINANTIANNNIVWRNVNIVDDHDMDRPISLIVRNTDPRNRAIAALLIRLPRNANGLSFARYGQVTFELDPRLTRLTGDAVRPDGLTGRGATWTLASGAEQAQLTGLILPPGGEGRLTIRLRRPPANAPRDVFRLEVEQWQLGLPGTRAAGVRIRRVGGVSYDIRTGGSTAAYVPPRGG